MEKKFEKKDKWDLLLDDQLNREAALLEEVLSNMGDESEEYQETDEQRAASFEKLIARLKADGIYREDDDSEEEILKETTDHENVSEEPPAKEVPAVPLRRNAMSRRLAKVAGIVIVSGMCVFAASMTSEANRNYWLHNMRILTGKDTRDVTDNDDTNEKVNADEYEAIAIIEKELQIDVPEFYYRPEGFEYLSYEADAIAGIARVEYQYKEGIIDLYVDKNSSNSKTDVKGILGEEESVIQSIYENLEIKIGSIVDDKDELYVCYAKWEQNNVNYILSGRIEMEKLKKIVKEMAF